MKAEVRRRKAEAGSQTANRAVDPNKLVAEIRREFAKAADAEYRESIKRFFKEPIDVYGVRTPDARRIQQTYFNKVKHLPKSEILEICEMLHRGDSRALGHDHPRNRGQSGGVGTATVFLGGKPWQSLPKYEEHAIAFSWVGKLVKKLEPQDFSTL
jgi:hypothetical protein